MARKGRGERFCENAVGRWPLMLEALRLIYGAGWVSGQHAAAYQRNPATEVRAIGDRSLDRARARAESAGLGGIALYDDLEKALRHPGIDIVSICTPQHVHCENVLAAAAAGKHLVIAKPVAISLEQLRTMREAVRKAGVRTVVSFVLRWNPLFRTLKKLLAEGAFGRPYCVETDCLSYNGSWWSGWNDARTIAEGVSALLVGGCHAVDALRWFAAEGEFEAAQPEEVFAVRGGRRKGQTREYNPLTNTWIENAPPMEYDGLEIVLVRFTNGVAGKVSVSAECVMPYRFPIRIFGDRFASASLAIAAACSTIAFGRTAFPVRPTGWKSPPSCRTPATWRITRFKRRSTIS